MQDPDPVLDPAAAANAAAAALGLSLAPAPRTSAPSSHPSSSRFGAPPPTSHAVLPASLPATLPAPVPAEDPKAAMRRLMDLIPTSKEGVWAYQVKWSAYDPATTGEKVKGWVAAKVRAGVGGRRGEGRGGEGGGQGRGCRCAARTHVRRPARRVVQCWSVGADACVRCSLRRPTQWFTLQPLPFNAMLHPAVLSRAASCRAPRRCR